MAVNSSSSSSDASVGSTDRISNLPDEISGHILGYLPICDAVRTCILSRRWRYSWMKAVQFNLYYDDCEEKTMTQERFFRLVLRVLVSHVGPIHKCEFRPNCDEVQELADVERDVDTWLRLLSTKDVKHLTIECDADMARTFKSPPFIYQCLGISRLTLGSCSLEYTIAFKGFPNLVRLDLWHVDVYGDMLEKVIANCPLEMLFLDSCDFCSYDSYSHKTAITAPNLRVLDIVCAYNELDRIYLKYTPSLRVASFVREDFSLADDCISDSLDVFKCMPNVEVLTFGCRLYETLYSNVIPKKLPEVLENLKTLTLREMDALYADHVSLMFSIIRSSPNLQNLEIQMDGSGMLETSVDNDFLGAVLAYLVVEVKEEFKTSLINVSLIFERSHSAERIAAEITLVYIIVSCSPALRNLVIKGPKELSRSLKRLGLASSNLNIKYSNA